MKNSTLLLLLFLFGLTTSCNSQNKGEKELLAKGKYVKEITKEHLTDPVNADTIKVGTVEKTAEQWKEQLSPEEFHILREGGTEPAFENEYYNTKTEGIYYCGACGLPVYSSQTKFHSGTGWPSFWAPIDPKLVKRQPDKRFGMTRTEVVCAQCGSHFGHIFNWPGVPTEERHCLNSLALDFKATEL